MPRRIIYIGWVDQGNLGDDLCRDIFLEEFHQYEHNTWEIKTISPQQIRANDFVSHRPDLVVLGGGSLLEPYYMVPLLWAQECGIPTTVWGSGVDNLSAENLAQIHTGKKLNGIQMNKAEMIVHVLKHCVQVSVRGPHTLAYLRSLGFSENLEISGDPGLLLSILDTGEEYIELFEDDIPVVGINWGTSQNRLFGSSESNVCWQMAQVIKALSSDFKIILYAVWPPDLALLKRLASLAGTSKNVMVCRDVPSPTLLCTLLKKVLFTINFKLHANVFTAAMGNPFISLGYRSKCFDFASSLDTEELVISTGEKDLKEKVLSLSYKIANNPELYCSRISRKKELYCGKLRRLIHQYVKLMG